MTTLLLVALAACRTVAWQDSTTATEWNGLRLHRAALGAVAARDEDAASDVYFTLEDTRTALQRHGVADPGPVLAIAVSFTDPPLLGDPLHTAQQLVAWHRVQLGRRPPSSPAAGDDATVEDHGRSVPEEVVAIAAHAVAAAIPLDAPELALPDDWRRQAQWAVVVPTTDCLDSTADAVLDLALEHGEITLAQRLLMAPFMSLVRSRARAELRLQARSKVLDAAVAAAHRRIPVDAGVIARVRAELGLDRATDGADLAADLPVERVH